MPAAIYILLLAVLALAVYAATGGSILLPLQVSTTDGDNVTNSQAAPAVTHHIVPTDPTTWPSGDKIWDCCRAIALAEGYNVAGSVPGRLNNPGDISDGAATYGSENHDGSNVTTFPDASTGWQWLYSKVSNAANGLSEVYSPDMTWREIAAKWAGDSGAWATNVTNVLGVSPDSTLGAYVFGA